MPPAVPFLRAAVILCLALTTSWANTNLLTNGSFSNSLTAWTYSGNVSTSSGFSLTRDASTRSVLFQTVQQQGLPLNLSLDFVFGVMSGSVPPGTFADTAYFSIYEASTSAALRPDLDQFALATPIFDATSNGFTNLAAGVSIQPSSRGPAWWTVVLTNYIPSYDFVAPTLEVYNFNGITNDSTAPMTDVVMNSVPEPGTAALLCLALVLTLIVRARRVRHLPVVLLALLCAAGPLRAQNVTALGPRVHVTAGNETSAFDRATRVVTQTADVTVTNAGDRPIKAPLRVRIALAGSGDLGRVTLGDVIAGAGEDVRPFRDLSALLPPSGLAPGGSVRFTLRLVRPFDVQVSYQMEAQGVFNRDPSPAFDAPLAAVAGEEVSFDAGASDDGDGGKQISYAWNFGDGGTSDAAAPKRTFAKPGRYDVVLTVADTENAKSVLRKTITVLPSANFAVARTRTLDASGQPLGSVSVRQRAGTEVTDSVSDASTGFAALGGEPGDYIWRFSRDGYLPVWRKASLLARQILFVPSPWLVRENAKEKAVSPLRELVLGGTNEPATITFAAGAFAAEGSAGFTPIGPQALPLPLPAGWSPLGAFYLSLPSTPSQTGALVWVPSDKLGSDDALAMLKYDADLLQWTVLSLPASGASPASAINEAGTYALVVADKGARAPPSAQVGAALPAATDIIVDSSAITATGSVDSSKITASREAAAMTTAGRVVFTGGSDLPSGTFFRTEIEETYNLANGRTQRTPVYDTSFFAYQRPGDTDAKTLHAAFPLRPTRIISPEQIDTAKIEADILTGDSYAASLFDPTGGRIAAENLAVSADGGDLSGSSLAELRLLDVKGFEVPLAGRAAVAAFQLAVGNLVSGRGLDVELSALAPNKDFVVARYVAKDEEEGLEPVERLRSDANGNAISVEPHEGVRLPGVTGSGQYVVVAVDRPQSVVSGVARNLAGDAVAGLAVRISGLPWLTFSAANGAYNLVAPQGAKSTVAVTDPADGNSGSEEVDVALGAGSTTADLRAVITAPRVASVSPVDGAQKVRTATPVTIRFSEPIDPATFGADAMTLSREGGVLVQGSLSLNPAGTEATFLPTNPLENAATYAVDLSAAIKDRQGLALAGARRFSFTVIASSERAPGAQLVIYEPGADNIPQQVRSMLVGYNAAAGSTHVVAHGSAGTADPEVPVILVNQNTGETATVLSKPDGSFANFINAAEEDFIEAVFVNANGTRVTVPATRQIYDNGRIGLYRYGGILEASNEEAGKVEVIIEPQAIADRTVFRLERKSIAETVALLKGLVPQEGAVVTGGFTFESEGSELASPPSIKMTVQPDELGLPEGTVVRPENFVLAEPTEVEGVRVFDIFGVPERSAPTKRTRSVVPIPPLGLPFVMAEARRISGVGTLLTFLRGGNLDVAGSVSAEAGRGLVEAGDEKRVPGAFVFPGDVDEEGGPLKDSNGRLLPPELLDGVVGTTTSPQNGGFRLSVPVDYVKKATPAIFAVSSKFPGNVASTVSQFVGDGDVGNFARKAFPHFPAPDLSIATDRIPPKISFAFNPPKPGALGNLSPFALNISSSDSGSDAPPELKLSLVSFTPIDEKDKGKTAAGNLAFSLVEDLQLGSTRRQKWQMNAFIPAEAEFEITSRDSSGNEELARARVTIEPSVLLYAGGKGPMVIGTSPQADSVGVSRAEPIIIRFSEPMDPASLVFVDTMFSVPVVDARLADQNRELIVRLAPATSDPRVSATISPLLQNAAGGFLDQDPTTEQNDSFSFSFEYASDPPSNKIPLTDAAGIVAGRSLPGGISYYFAIDRGGSAGQSGKPDESKLVCLQATASEPLKTVAAVPLPPFARDVLYLGRYNYKVPHKGKQSADLLAVIGGLGGIGQDNWIRVFDVTDPAAPSTIASSNFGLGGTTVGVKLAWSAPRLGILLLGAEDTSVMEVDLQLLIHAKNLSSYADEPLGGAVGIDLNGDGDYGDDSESIPQPMGAAPAVGLINGGAVETTQLTTASAARWRFTDFDLGGAATDIFSGLAQRPFGGQWLVACGRSMEEGGKHGFWVLKAPGKIVNDDEDGVGFLEIEEEPWRVKLLPGRELIFPGPDGTQTTEFRDLALVSTSGSNDGHILVIDVTDPAAPIVLNKLKIPNDDGKPRSITVGRDGLLYVACMRNMLVLDPRYLAPVGQAAADPVGSYQRAYVHRISGLGTGNRAFVANGMDELAVAFGGKSLLRSFLPPAPPVVSFLRLVRLSEESQSLYEWVFAPGPGMSRPGWNPPKVTKRISQNGRLEIVEPYSLTLSLLFSPRLIGEASFAPANQSLPQGFPLWKLKKAPPIGPTPPIPPAPVTIQSGFANADLQPHFPAYGKLDGAILAPLLPFLDFGLLAAVRPDLHEVYCEDQKVDVAVYPGFPVDRKFDLASLAPLIQRFEWITIKAALLISRLTGGKAELSVESKGTFGYKGQWAEKPSSNEAIYTFAVNGACDPLIALGAEMPAPPPLAILAPLSTALGAKWFAKLEGAVSLVGSLERDAEDQMVRALELGGKMSVGYGVKVEKKFVEAKVSGEGGLSVKARCDATFSPPPLKVVLKSPSLTFEGLSINVSFKLMTGRLRPYEQNFAPIVVLKPAELIKANELPLF